MLPRHEKQIYIPQCFVLSQFLCIDVYQWLVISLYLVFLRPLVARVSSVWRGKCHRVQQHTLLDVLFTVVVSGLWAPVACSFYCLHFFLSLQGSLYETSNLDRGSSNRKKKIEEFSRSSREKLVQSKNKMFSKFTSILQHAVEAVSFPS